MPKRHHHQPHASPDGVTSLAACPLCAASYDPHRARVLGAHGEERLLHVACGGCGNAMLTLVVVTSSGISSVGLITDLSFEDAQRFREAPPVSADHVLAAHALPADIVSRLL